jgi:hypothetical protein
MKTDKEKHGLRGPVKSVHIANMHIEQQEGQITEKPWFSHTMSFDQYGRLIEQINRNPDGSEWRTVNDYSDSGELLATRGYDPSGVLSSEVRYLYDDERRLIAEQYIAQDRGITVPTTYDYDSEGRKIRIQEYERSGEAGLMISLEGADTLFNPGDATRAEIHYDHEDAVVEAKFLKADGELVSRVEITRDARGNPLEEVQYVANPFPLDGCAAASCSTEEMDALTEEQKAELRAEIARMFPPGTPMFRHTHRYDTEGRLIESTLTMMGIDVSRKTYTYDALGNKSEEVSYGEDGKFASKAIFTREYDTHGNWTKELVSAASSWDAEFGLSTPVSVTHREITFW